MEYRIIVNFDDVDYARVVYFGRYLKFAEHAQAHVLRSYNLSHKRMAEEFNVATPVIRTEFSYFSPARLDDVVIIHTEMENLTDKGFDFKYRFVLAENDKLLCRGMTSHRFIDLNTFQASQLSMELFAYFDKINKELRIS